MKSLKRLKEPFCGVSHGVGIVLSCLALVVLLVEARGRPWHTLSFTVYGISLILLYTASTLYHSLHLPEPQVALLQKFDHSAIFVLIAGSYTPVCLIAMRGVWGWSLLGSAYVIAALGIGLSLFARRAPDWLRVALCVLMGWMAVLALVPLREALSPAGLHWLIAGGIVYSVGTIIYATDRPHLWPGRFSAHDLWHLFVLGGSACHFVVMLRFVAPAA